MKITLCGSLTFSKEMEQLSLKLSALGHTVQLPEAVARQLVVASDKWKKNNGYDPIRLHQAKIASSDAILVCNFDKNSVVGYVGGAVLMEMGFAYVLEKKIFLLNEIPKLSYSDEIEAMKPIVIHGNYLAIH